MKYIPSNTVILVLLLALVTFVQIKLCKHKSKYLGLIIPFFNVLFALIIAASRTKKSEIYGSLFLLLIPAAINLTIYFLCKGKNGKSEIDKMKIDDLE